MHNHLDASFPRVHATLTKELLGDPRPNSLLYNWTGTDPSLAPVVLMGHQDVVPVVPETKKQWEHDAFSGDIADGYIWGRGALDDKVMVMAILEAVEMLLAARSQPKRTIYLSFGQDEEVMGLEGTRHIVEVLRARGVDKVAFVLDEGVAMTAGLFPGVGLFSPVRRRHFFDHFKLDPSTNDDAKMRKYLNKEMWLPDGTISDGSASILGTFPNGEVTVWQVVSKPAELMMWIRFPTKSSWLELDLKRYFTMT